MDIPCPPSEDQVPESCPSCDGWLEYQEDTYGPRLVCVMGCWQQDLLQATPEHMQFLALVGVHNEKLLAQQSTKDAKLGRQHRPHRRKPVSNHKPHGGKHNPGWDNFMLVPPAKIVSRYLKEH